MLAKAPQGGVKAITAIQEMLEDTQEEVSLHVGFAEARTHPCWAHSIGRLCWHNRDGADFKTGRRVARESSHHEYQHAPSATACPTDSP